MAEKKSVIGLIFAIAAVAFMVGSFASPYWIESFSKSENRFVKCGLWEFCFNDYTFWKDYNGKRYLGCWYIFSDQYRPIWEWLSPRKSELCLVLDCHTFYKTFILNLHGSYLKFYLFTCSFQIPEVIFHTMRYIHIPYFL